MKNYRKSALHFILASLLAFAHVAFASAADNSAWCDFQKNISGTDRIAVTLHDKNGPKTVFETNNPKDISEFLESVKIISPKEAYYCPCINNYTIDLFRNGEKIANIANRHSRHICSQNYNGNAGLADPYKWAKWFEDRGIDYMRKDLESQARQAEKSKTDTECWETAMPESFKPFWGIDMRQGYYSKKTNFQPISEAVAKEFPDECARALMLLKWYGSGEGNWSGFPAYEFVAEDLLKEIPAEKIAEIADTDDLDERQLAGAARFFAMTENYSKLSPKTKEKLLEFTLKSGYDYNIHMAKRAFESQK